MKRLFIILTICLLGPIMAAHAAVTISAESVTDVGPMSIYECTITHATTAGTTAVMTYPINGLIDSVESNPGSTAPTALYDLSLEDDWGLDVMGTALNNLSATVTETNKPYVNSVRGNAPTKGLHTITSSGNTAVGATVQLRIKYFRK